MPRRSHNEHVHSKHLSAGSRQSAGNQMPREIVTIQIGQCGNQVSYLLISYILFNTQIGRRFWDMAVHEHGKYNEGAFDESLSSFFRNVDSRFVL